MADEVDYESDTAMAVEEDDEPRTRVTSPPPAASATTASRRVTLETSTSTATSSSGDTKSSSAHRVVKGRGKGAASMDSERYPDDSGVFEKLHTSTSTSSTTRDHASALKSVEGWILFVSGVHEEAQEDDILDAFGEDAAVKNLHMNLDRRTGFVKGYALVEFADFDAAKDALERMDNAEILGSVVHVDWAFRKEQKDARRDVNRSRNARR